MNKIEACIYHQVRVSSLGFLASIPVVFLLSRNVGLMPVGLMPVGLTPHEPYTFAEQFCIRTTAVLPATPTEEC